jgi:trk system potassium uptake protein TrkA
MRVVIVGAGEVGFNAARMLSHEGHRVVVVEENEASVEQTAQRLDALVVHGNGASPRVLREVNIEDSDLLVATTNSDEVNIVACLAAKAQGVRRTVARLHNPDYQDPRQPLAPDLLGIDFVIRTELMAADEIRESLLVPGPSTWRSSPGRA